MANESDVSFVIRIQDETYQTIKRFESNIIRTVGAITAAFATFKAAAFPISAASEFERELKNVQKTTDFTDKEIKQLSASLTVLSTKLGTSAVDLARVAAIAGQLGLGREGKDAVEAFTGSVARAAVTLDLTVDKTAEFGAQLANVFSVPIANVEKIFSLLNEVSNNSVATANELADIMKRIGNTAGLTITQVAALAGYARELGVPVEQAGTTFVNAFINLQTKVQVVTKLLRISAEEWGRRIRADPLQALKDVARALDLVTDQSKQAALIDELFGSGRQFSALQKVVSDVGNDFSRLNLLLEKGTQAFITGQSSIKEYENIMEATAKQADVLSQAFTNLAIKGGEKALEPIVRAMRNLVEVLESDRVIAFVEDMSTRIADMIEKLTEWAIAIGKFIPSLDWMLSVLKLLLGLKAAEWFYAASRAMLAWLASFSAATIGRVLGPALRYLTSVPDAVSVQLAKSTTATQAAVSNIQTIFINLIRSLETAVAGINTSVAAMLPALDAVKAAALAAATIAEQAAAAAIAAATAATVAAKQAAAAAGATAGVGAFKQFPVANQANQLLGSVVTAAMAANAAKLSQSMEKTYAWTQGAAQEGKTLFNAFDKGKQSVQAIAKNTGFLEKLLGGVLIAGGAVSKLFGFIGKKLLGIVTGPLGTLLLMVSVIFPEKTAAAFSALWSGLTAGFNFFVNNIRRVIGPIFGLSDRAAEAAEDMRLAERAKQIELDKTISAYDEYLKKLDDVQTKEGGSRTNLFKSMGKQIDEFTKDLETALAEVVTVSGVLRQYGEAEQAQVQVIGSIAAEAAKASNAIADLTAARELLVAAFEQPVELRVGVAAGLSDVDLQKAISQLDTEITRQSEIFDGYNAKLTEAHDTLKRFSDAQERAKGIASSSAFLNEFLKTQDSYTVSILETLYAQKQNTEQLRLYEEELQKIQKSTESLKGGAGAALSAEQAKELDRQRELNGLIADARAKQQAYVNTITEAKKALGENSIQVKTINYLSNQTASSMKNVLDVVQAGDKIKFVEGMIQLRQIQEEKTRIEKSVWASQRAYQEALRSRSSAEFVAEKEQEFNKYTQLLAEAELVERDHLATLHGIEGQWNKNTAAGEDYARYQTQNVRELNGELANLKRIDIGAVVSSGNGLAEAFRNSKEAVEALTKYAYFKGLKKQIDEMTRAVEHFYDKAKGAFDNTYNEVSALAESFQGFINSLRTAKLEQTIKLKYEIDKTKDVERQYDKYIKDIEKKYERLTKNVKSETQLEYLEEQKQDELEMLEVRKQNELVDIRRKALLDEYTQKLALAREYMRQANDTNSIDEAMELKGAAKETLKDVQKLVVDAQNLSKTDIFGKTSTPAFSAVDIEKMVNGVKEVSTDFRKDIVEMNTALKERATQMKDSFGTAVEPLNRAFESAKNVVEQMRQVFPGLDVVIERMQKTPFPADMQRAADTWVGALERMSDATQAGTNIRFDAAQLKKDFDAFSTQAAKSFGEAVSTELRSLTVNLPLSSRDLSQQLRDAFNKAGVSLDWSYMKTQIEQQSDKERVTISANARVENVEPPPKRPMLSGIYQADELTKVPNLPPVEGAYKITEFITSGSITPTGGAQKNARGGFIAGPGTGTSDSILSWLSNGEYVIDAFTTRFFGSSFFRVLQLLARSGRSSLDFVLPRFAGGGLAGAAPAMAMASGVRDVVDVNLNFASDSFSLQGEREEVKRFVRALKHINRGKV